WQSIEIDMSLYTFDLSGVFQLLIDPAGPNTMYVANFYFSKGNTLSIEENELIQFNAYPNPTENGWNIKSMNEAINSIQVYDILGKVVLTMNPNANEAQIDASGLNTGLYFAKVNSAVGSKTIKLIKK
ncbi:MAG: putative secreted protein, partial [Flavobacteriaceae bacterium]